MNHTTTITNSTETGITRPSANQPLWILVIPIFGIFLNTTDVVVFRSAELRSRSSNILCFISSCNVMNNLLIIIYIFVDNNREDNSLTSSLWALTDIVGSLLGMVWYGH